MPIPYNKPPLTPEQQANLLLSRGLRGISKPDLVKKLLDACSIEYDFVYELKKIMRSVRVEQLAAMGFPDDWDKEKLFR
ncbi:hypothetical protein II898_11125 [bacterium]|nr:hypothetical protein [bacterium]